jgi:hypothetical protein
MPRSTTAVGAAAAVLVVALGAAAPSAATPWEPRLHGAESPSAEPSPVEDHGDHTVHGTGDAAPEDHADHGAEGAAPDEAGHDGHDGGPDPVADQTRVSVLGGFGAVNAAVVGSAFLLRRRGRRTGRQPRTGRGSHR